MPRFVRTDQGRVPVPDDVPRGQEEAWFDKYKKQHQAQNTQAAATAATDAMNPRGVPSQDAIGEIKRWLTDEPSTSPGYWLGMPGRVTRSIGRMVLPGSKEQAATDVGIAAASAVAPGVGALAARAGASPFVQGAARVATRLAVPAAAAGAVGGKEAAGEAAMAAGVGELVGLPGAVGAFSRKFGHLDSNRFLLNVRNRLGPEFADAVGASIGNPQLRRLMSTPEDVARIVTRERGQKVLGTQFDDMETRIIRTLKRNGVNQIEVPIAAAELAGYRPPESIQMTSDPRYRSAAPRQARPLAVVGPQAGSPQLAGLTPPQTPNAPPGGQPATHYLVPVDEALKMGKMLRDKALAGSKDEMGARAGNVFALGQEVTNTVNAAVDRFDPTLSHDYRSLRDSFRKFYSLREVIKQSPTDLFPSAPRLESGKSRYGGVSIDLPNFWRAMRENLPNLSPEDFPQLHAFFTGSPGTLLGPQRVSPLDVLRHARLYMRNPQEGSHLAAGESIPRIPMVWMPPELQGRFVAGQAAGRAIPTASAIAATPSIVRGGEGENQP